METSEFVKRVDPDNAAHYECTLFSLRKVIFFPMEQSKGDKVASPETLNRFQKIHFLEEISKNFS